MESLWIYNRPPQVRRIRIPLYSPPSISRIPFPLPPFPFEVENPTASCAFGHCLFLTSYMLSSKVICDDTYLNKMSISYAENHTRNKD